MTITISKKVTEKTQVEIPLPSFWTNGYRTLGFLNEQTVIAIVCRETYTNIISGTPDEMKWHTEDIAEYLPIHESQFFHAHEEAIESLSLSPKLTHKNYIADLESIGLKRKEA